MYLKDLVRAYEIVNLLYLYNLYIYIYNFRVY